MMTTTRFKKKPKAPDVPEVQAQYATQDDEETDKQLQYLHATIRVKKNKKLRGFVLGTLRRNNIPLVTAAAAPAVSIHVDSDSHSEEHETQAEDNNDDEKVSAHIRDVKINWDELESKHVRYLVIDDEDNSMSKLPDEIKHLKDLREFTLRWGKIEDLPVALYGMSLTKISVSKCALNNIDGIQVVVSLEELELTSNQIRNIPNGIGHLSNLKKLDVSGNQLKVLPESIGRLKALTSLSVSSNAIDALPITIGNLPKLEFLNVSRNKLEFIPPSVGKLTLLVTMQLTHNKLSELPDTLENMKSLKYLFLGHNRFTCIPSVIPSIGSLIDLNMHENSIQSVDISLPSIRALLLDKNQLSQLSDAMLQCKSLEILSVRSNRLTCITKDVAKLTKLKALYVAGNEITHVPEELSHLKDLRHLVVSQTRVNDLPNSISLLKRLTVLDFSDSLMNYELKEAYKKGGLKQLQQRLQERESESVYRFSNVPLQENTSDNGYPVIPGNSGYDRRWRDTIDLSDQRPCSVCVTHDLRKDIDGRTSSSTASSSFSLTKDCRTSEGSSCDHRFSEPSSESDVAPCGEADVAPSSEADVAPSVVDAKNCDEVLPDLHPNPSNIEPKSVLSTATRKEPEAEGITHPMYSLPEPLPDQPLPTPPPPPLHPRKSKSIISLDEESYVETLIAKEFKSSPAKDAPKKSSTGVGSNNEVLQGPLTTPIEEQQSVDVLPAPLIEPVEEQQPVNFQMDLSDSKVHLLPSERNQSASPSNKPEVSKKPKHLTLSVNQVNVEGNSLEKEVNKESDRASTISISKRGPTTKPKPVNTQINGSPKTLAGTPGSAESPKLFNGTTNGSAKQDVKTTPLKNIVPNNGPKVRPGSALASRIAMFQ